MSEQPKPFSPDDPRLSAYLLGELDGDELAAFEDELKANPETQSFLEELRETTSVLGEVFDREPAPALSAAQRSTILSAAAEAKATVPSKSEKPVMNNKHRGTWAIVAAIAALGIVMAVVMNRPDTEPNDRTLAQRENAKTAAKTEGYETRFGRMREMEELGEAIDPLSVLPVADESRSSGSSGGGVGGGGIADGLKSFGSTSESDYAERGIKSRSNRESAALQLAHRNESLARKTTELKSQVTLSQDSKAANFEYKPRASKPAAPVVSNPVPGRPIAGGASAPGQSLAAIVPDSTLATPAPFGPGGKKDVKGIKDGFAKFSEEKLVLEGEDEAPSSESYEPIFENDFIRPRGELALSTFSIDVDTASYSNMRRFLTHGQRPPADSVRIEELVNYFHYDYAPPANGDPFSVHTEVAICPWKPEHHLVRIGLKGRELDKQQRPLSNLVFLVDVSGSMSSQNKLPLVKKALTMLVNEMGENDRISLVTYASNAAVRLPSISGEHRSEILSAIHNLKAGGSTNGEGGIHLAYTQAIGNFIEDGSNRVILCTDGDFNVGVSGDQDLATLIEDKAKKSGVFLSVFGFGMGNYKDSKLEKLSGKGNGNYAYIDNAREAKKVFVEELTGTLYTIAKDVKIQVEFNPAHVGAYRLIGYENRILAAQDFNDDTKDAGEIGAGHTVTALYEVIPAGKMPAIAEDIDRLKYQPAQEVKDAKPSPEMLTLKLRFKQPDEDVSVKRQFPVKAPGKRRSEPTVQTEWQAAVAAFGMVLRGSKHKGNADLRLVKELAIGSRGPDPSGRRREFVDLVLTAERLATGKPAQAPPKVEKVSKEDAEKKASVQGKYRKLLKTIHAPGDLQNYGAFHDYGYWEGSSYHNQEDLPNAHWVYVYPNWYLWGKDSTPSE